MIFMWSNVVKFISGIRWLKNEDGVAAIEAALVFPILMVLLLGTFDLGNGILANQKTIRASQVVADLIARGRNVNTAMIDEAIDGGELAFEPMSTSTFGVDIISFSFDDDANPVIEWRETRGMDPLPDVFSHVIPLAQAGEGVVMVVIEYEFEPVFAGFVVNNIPMQEIAFSRGRRDSVVERI